MSDARSSARPSYDPQALLNAQPVIVAVIDPATYTVQFQNETGLKKFGDISGQTCHEKIAGCPNPCAFCKMPEAVTSGEVTANEVPLPQNQWVLIQWSKAVTADGRIHVIETITDITARKQMEEALHKAEKTEALGRLAGGMAHEFNNLLTVINGYSEQVLQQLDDHDPNRAKIRQIQETAERAAVLTHNLVAFSQHQVLQPAIQDLNVVLAEMGPQLRRLTGAQIELSTVLGSDTGQIVADRPQLEQIIVNLVNNARDAMPQGGRITMTTTSTAVDETSARRYNARPGIYAQLSVADTGCGIEPEAQGHIFDPFFSQKESGKGGGLGLASVHGIVEQSGGFIEVFSEAGHGSTFSVSFPRCEHIRPVRPVPQAAGAPEWDRNDFVG